MATGMVLVIVTRNIDLSVGSILGFVGMIIGVMQARCLPGLLGLRASATCARSSLLVGGRRSAGCIGAVPGLADRLSRHPSFIVTLGGLLVWRGAAWWVTSGQTVAPMDATFS